MTAAVTKEAMRRARSVPVRRSPGEGSIQRAETGWKAVLSYRDEMGKPRRAVRRTRTKTGAVEALQKLKLEAATTGSLTDGRTTVGVACVRYLEVKRGAALASSTIRSHEWMTGVIIDGIGKRRLGDLTVANCDEFLRQAADGLNGRRAIGPAHLRRLRSTLVSVIFNAEREGFVTRNVAQLSILPKRDDSYPKERMALTLEEVECLLEASRGTVLQGVISLCGWAALRPSEARALNWSDVDFGLETVAITKQLDEFGNPTGPKTRRAGRRIGMNQATANALTHWRRAQCELQLRAGEFWIASDLVLTTSVGTHFDKDNLRRSLYRLCETAGVRRISPYELRHTAITLLSNEGYTNWQLADYAGTSTRMIEDTYRHRTEGVIRLDLLSDAPGRHQAEHQSTSSSKS